MAVPPPLLHKARQEELTKISIRSSFSQYFSRGEYNGLNEELGRHRGREGKSECVLCGAECESVVHVLWE